MSDVLNRTFVSPRQLPPAMMKIGHGKLRLEDATQLLNEAQHEADETNTPFALVYGQKKEEFQLTHEIVKGIWVGK